MTTTAARDSERDNAFGGQISLLKNRQRMNFVWHMFQLTAIKCHQIKQYFVMSKMLAIQFSNFFFKKMASEIRNYTVAWLKGAHFFPGMFFLGLKYKFLKAPNQTLSFLIPV